MNNLLTAQSKGKLKESGVQTAVTLVATIVGAFTGQAIGRTGFLASVPVIFAGEYFDQPYVTALGAGMASSLTAPSSVNGMDGLEGTEKFYNLKAAETRVKNHAKALKRAMFLGEVEPTGGAYTFYLSDSDVQDMGQLDPRTRMRQINSSPTQRRQLMSRLSPFMEGLGEALAEYDEFLDGHEDVELFDTLQKMKTNLEGIRDTVYAHPEELMGIDENDEEGFDDEMMDTINGIIGMINGASIGSLNGNDEAFLDDFSVEVGSLEGLLGIEDDDEDDYLNGNEENDDFDSNGSSNEFSDSPVLFGFDDDEDDLGGYEDSFDDVMDGIF